MALMVREFSRNKAADSLELRAKINEPKKFHLSSPLILYLLAKHCWLKNSTLTIQIIKTILLVFSNFLIKILQMASEFFRNFRLKKQLVSNFKLFYGQPLVRLRLLRQTCLHLTGPQWQFLFNCVQNLLFVFTGHLRSKQHQIF